MKLALLLLPLAVFGRASAANILGIFQEPTFSHILYQTHLVRALAQRGYNLTVFTTHRMELTSNVTQYHFAESHAIEARLTNPMERKQHKLGWLSVNLQHEPRVYFETAKTEYAHPELQRLLKEGKRGDFDLVIIECYFCHLTVLADIFDCPVVVSVASEANFMLHALMGNEFSPALYPEVYALPFLHRHLTLGERIESLAFFASSITFGEIFKNLLYGRRLVSEFFPPQLKIDVAATLQRRTALLLTNTNDAFGYARPLMPNTVQVGFMHIEPPKDIKNKKLKDFLDDSTEGVIVMGFGTKIDVRSLSEEIVEKFFHAFNRTKMSVVWKSQRLMHEIPANVLLVEKLPFDDVFAHPNVKVFIGHGGLMSAYEAIDREVPMIIFPIAYDHGANAKMLVNNGVAVELVLNTFSEENLLAAIEEVTKDEYKERIQRLKKRVYDQPIHPRDFAVWHIESVLRNGNDSKMLKSVYAEHLQQYYLDLIALVCSVLVALWSFYKVLGKMVQKRKNQKLKCD